MFKYSSLGAKKTDYLGTINCTMYGSMGSQKLDNLGIPCITKSDRKYYTLLLAPPGALCTVENQQAAEPDQDH